MAFQRKQTYNIPAEAALDVIGGKWKMMILCHLNCGPVRTSDLKRGIPGISQKVLTAQLRELEEDGIIIRTVYGQVPPKVEYSMSELGKTLKSILDQRGEWGKWYIRERFQSIQ